MGIICPKCEKDDHIYKISGIVSSGSSSVRLSGRTTGASFPIGDSNPSIIAGYTDIEGEQTTDLAQKLAPLEKPTTKGNGSGCMVTVGAVGATIILFLSKETFKLSEVTVGVGCGIICLIAPLIYFYDLYLYRKLYYTKDLEYWKESMMIWKRLYYCTRDDCVFDPERNIQVRPDDIQSLYPAYETENMLEENGNEFKG